MLLFITEQGMIKQVAAEEFDVTRRTVAATKLADNDKVVCVNKIEQAQEIILRTQEGVFLRFPISEVPEKKKKELWE